MIYIVPIIALSVFIFGAIKKINVYDSFVAGIREAVTLTISLIPYLAAVFMLTELMRAGGLSAYIGKALSPAFNAIGIPAELTELIILRPLTGSGSLAVLENIYAEYGVDSYIARTASVIMGSTDTVMYVAAIYFSGVRINKGKNKNTDKSVSTATEINSISDKRAMNQAITIALVASFFGAVCSAFICRFI